jgi:hypothetical protein
MTEVSAALLRTLRERRSLTAEQWRRTQFLLERGYSACRIASLVTADPDVIWRVKASGDWR